MALLVDRATLPSRAGRDALRRGARARV